MLVLSRNVGEFIHVPQCEMTVTIVSVERAKPRHELAAPNEVNAYREEVWQRIGKTPGRGPDEP